MLRPYQYSAINDIQNHFDNGTNEVCLCMPTGSGKTYTFTELAKDYHAQYHTKVLIIVHRKELLKQTVKSLGVDCFEIVAKRKYVSKDYKFYVAMVETLKKRSHLLPEFGLVIVDEAHIGNFKNLPLSYNHKIGATATPLTNPPLSAQYKEIVMPITISELIGVGKLSSCVAYGFKEDEFILAEKSWSIKAGEYTDADQMNLYKNQMMVNGVVNAYKEKALEKKTLVFNVNVEHCKLVNDAFLKAGYNSKMLTAENSDIERTEILSWLKYTPNAILQSVGVLTTGFDEPTIEAIVLNRATASLNLYLQMIGRGGRITDDKNQFTLIDLGRNVVRHNMYEFEHNWRKYFFEGKPKKKKKDGNAPVKHCPNCEALIPTNSAKCAYCGFVIVKVQAGNEERHFELVKYVSSKPHNIHVESVFEATKSKGHSPYAAFYALAERLLNYEKRSNGIVNDSYIKNEISKTIDTWCLEFEKKRTRFVENYAQQAIDKVREQRIKKEMERQYKEDESKQVFQQKLDTHSIYDIFTLS